jgi:hypothetical protein
MLNSLPPLPATGLSGAPSAPGGPVVYGTEMILGPDTHFQRVDGRHPSVVQKLRFLEFGHLKHPALRTLSQRFADLGQALIDSLPDDAELTLALDLLRQAKDRAVGLAAVTHLGRDEDPKPAAE